MLKTADNSPLRRAWPGPEAAGKARRYVLYTALLATGMVLALYLLLGVWPFGGGTVVTGDLGGLYINFYAQLKRAFGGAAGFTYGFAKGLGGNLTALLAYYYASPCNLLYLLFPLRWFPVAASLAFMAKIVLSCVTFHVFIAYKFPGLCGRAVALSLCYGFMAYSFAYAQNPMWHDGLVMLPLVCLGIDRIVAGKPLTVYALSLGVAIFSDFYIAFMICIFAVLYFLYSMLLRHNTAAPGGGTEYPGRIPASAKSPAGGMAQRAHWIRNSRWAAPLSRFAAASLLAGGSCAALLLPALFNVNQNKGALLDFHFSLEPLLPLRQLPERLLWGSFAPADMEGRLPFLYCGALALLLAGCYFISRAVPWREKLLSGGMLLVFVLSFWLKGPDTLWHALKEPVWFPARYSFLFCFFLLVLAGRALAAGAVQLRPLLAAGTVLLAFLLFMTVFPLAVSRSRLLLNAALVLGFLALLLLLARAGAVRRRVLTGALAAFTALELLAGAFYISNQFDKYTLADYQSFVDAAGGTVDAIHAADASPGYRIAENWFRTLNDPLLLGYAGISHFASTQDAAAQSVLHNLGHRNYGGGGPYLSGGTAFADAVLGLKYLADTGARAVPAHWQEASVQAPHAVWQNPYAMPMAFTVPTAAPDGRATIWQQDMFAYQNDFAALLGAESPPFTQAVGYTLYSKDGQALPGTTLPPEARFELTATRTGRHYAWFSTEDYQLVPLLVNGNATAPYFSPDYAGVVDLGWLDAGETATVRFLNNAEIQLTGVLFACLDEAVLQGLVAGAWANAGTELPFSVRDGAVHGVFDATPQRATLYTSIPYDENWQAEISVIAPDGTATRTSAQPFMVMGGLLALPLSPGQNTVDLRFVPAGSAAGLWVSVCSLALLAAAVCFEHRRRIRRISGKG